MPLSWQPLPKEILFAIFNTSVEKSDLLQLQLVCKNWSLVAYQQLYHHVKTDAITSFPLVQTLQQSKYQPRLFVKCLDFTNESSNQPYPQSDTDIDYLHTLVSLCPNLTHIIVNQDTMCDKLYLTLMEMHKLGCLQHLQCIPDFETYEASFFRDSYNSAAMAMRNTLTRLVIVHGFKYPMDDRLEEEPEINMLKQLQHFQSSRC